MSRHIYLAKLGDWTFYQVDDHAFTGEFFGRPLFGYTVGTDVDAYGKPRTGELYSTLEHAMAAAIAEKYTGRRGAGGTGVGTAADWFMKMLRADQLEAVPDASGVMATALMKVKGLPRAPNHLARSTVIALEREGCVLARPADRD